MTRERITLALSRHTLGEKNQTTCKYRTPARHGFLMLMYVLRSKELKGKIGSAGAMADALCGRSRSNILALSYAAAPPYSIEYL